MEPVIANCYVCGKGVLDFDARSLLGHTYHSDCIVSLDATDPKWPQQKLDSFVDDPHKFFEEFKKDLTNKFEYFITFTRNPDFCTKAAFKRRVEDEMVRKHVLKYMYAFEHEDSNLHAHAKMLCKDYIKKSRDFKTFQKGYGNIDIKTIHKDNGIRKYLEKETEVFSTY